MTDDRDDSQQERTGGNPYSMRREIEEDALEPSSGGVSNGECHALYVGDDGAEPIEIIIVPRVTMNGGIFTRATMIPLKKPKAVPTTMIRISVGTIGRPCFIAVPPTMAAAIMTVPIERSIPPLMMTNVTPIAIKPM